MHIHDLNLTQPAEGRYEAAMRALQEVITAMQGGQWEEASDLYKAAKNTWQELRNTLDLR